MSVASGPNIVSSGLLFEYDMNNTGRSWMGKPTTNIIPYSQDYSNNGNFLSNWTGNLFNNWINSTVSTGFTAPDGSPTANSMTGYYSRWTASISASTSTVYTFSVWLKNNGLVNDVYLHVAFGLNGTLVNYSNTSVASISSMIGWTRYSVTVTSPSSGINQIQCGIDFGSSKSSNPTGYSVLVWGAQCEVNSYATPYVPSLGTTGSRSTSQALLDATTNSTAVANSLVYNSDNTFQFIYSNPSTVQIPLATAFNKLEGSINVWIYPTSYNGGNGIFVNRTDTTANALDWLWIGPYSNTFYFRLGDGSTCCNNDLTISSYSSVVPVNTWTNLCCTWSSGGTSCIYINGSLNTSRSISSIPSTSPSANGLFGCGHGNADSYYNGKMPVGQIYSRQLTATEVMQNFNAYRRIYNI